MSCKAAESSLNLYKKTNISLNNLQLCGATVLRKGSLKRHLRDKHAVTTLKFEPKGCPYCMELFEDFHALRQHVKDKHEAYRRVICDVSNTENVLQQLQVAVVLATFDKHKTHTVPYLYS